MDETPEQWESRRSAAEARFAAKMPDDQRREYFQMVMKARGTEAANKLIEATNAERRKQACA